jgi:hypothetical protein
VLTAATVQRVASASRLALAQSGQATITYREYSNGALQVSGTDSITFAGTNWNDASSQTFPAAGGQRAHTQSAINRIVDGQLYLYVEGRDGQARWYHDTNPSGHPSMHIPDPRTLFSVLDPAARFEIIGHRVADGIRLTGLRATRPLRPFLLGWLPGVTSRANLAQVTVWVDGNDVIRQITLQAMQTSTAVPLYVKKSANGALELLVPSKAYLKEAWASARSLRGHGHLTVRVDPSLPATVRHNLQVTSVTADFTGIGVRQVITAPQDALPSYGQG